MPALQKTPDSPEAPVGGSSNDGVTLTPGWKLAICVAIVVVLVLIFTATK